MSWLPDNEAVGRDALMLPWDKITYLFPPVPLLPKVVAKIKLEQIEAILICPEWPTTLWWLLVEELMVGNPMHLPHFKEAIKTVNGQQIKVYLDPLRAIHISGQILRPAEQTRN